MAFDYSSSFAGINNALGRIGQQNELAYKHQTLANLGQKIQSGDYDGAAQAAFAAGDAGTGLGLLKLQQSKQQEADWLKANSGILGGGAAPSVPAPGSTAPVPASLIQNESGGNWQAQNDAVGAGGAVGHFGRLQFGQARIQDAINSGALPAGTTPQAFMASPELQKRAEAWHFSDIDQKIQQNGFDKLIGQSINGVPITVDGLRAVAHLGGTEGMKKFVESGGRYNPADRNGTRLSDYFARHGGGAGAQPQPVQVAENEADVQRLEQAQANGTAVADAPAPGAAQAQGFAIPGGEAVPPSIANDSRVMNLQRALAGAPERFKPSIQSRLNILVEELKAQRAESAPTPSIKEYRQYRADEQAAGRTPGDFTSWKRANSAAGASNVNVDTKQEGEYGKTIGKALGERMDAISKEGDAARADSLMIGQLRELGGQIKNLGSGAALQGWLAEKGIKVGPNVSEIEAYNALVDKLTPQQRVPGTGASSDLDVKMFKSALPNLIRTPGGNAIILDTLDAVAQDKSARAAIADRALTGELKPQDAIKELRKLPDPMSAFKEARKSGFKNAPEPKAEQPAAAPVNGARQAPDGNWYVPDPARPGKYFQVQ